MEASQAEQDQKAQEDEGAVVGDNGLEPLERMEQEFQSGRESAPPAEAQSGVPLPEDRAAGVQPNEEFRGPTDGGTGPQGKGAPEAPAEGEAVEQDGTQH